MVKVIINSSKKVVIGFASNGRVEAVINWASKPATFVISVPAIASLNRAGLADFASAIKKTCTHVGAKIKKTVSLSGTPVDPDEQQQVPGEDCTVSYQIYKSDTRRHLFFTRYHESGLVHARCQAFSFTDIPSAVQLAHAAEGAANLMKQYEKLRL